MACILDGGKLTLSGTISDDWWGDSFSYTDVLLALAAVEDGSTLTVHINSGGGVATEGAAIHALLVGRRGRTDVVIEGIAASAASLIAMAGETVKIADGAVVMVHDPSGLTLGTSADHAKQIESLEALATAYARVYATKTGKSAEECREIMKAERWYTPEQAVEEGFADEVMPRAAAPVAMFDYTKYAHAPKDLRAQARNWLQANPSAAKSAATNRQPQEIDMTDKSKADEQPADKIDVVKMQADAVKADRERRAAVMALDEAKGREALADHLFASTDMSVEQIKAALSAAPAKEEASPATPEGAKMQTAGIGGDKRPQLRVDIVAAAKARAAKA